MWDHGRMCVLPLRGFSARTRTAVPATFADVPDGLELPMGSQDGSEAENRSNQS